MPALASEIFGLKHLAGIYALISVRSVHSNGGITSHHHNLTCRLIWSIKFSSRSVSATWCNLLDSNAQLDRRMQIKTERDMYRFPQHYEC